MNLKIKNQRLISHFEAEQNSAMQKMYSNPSPDAYKDPAAGEWGKNHPETILHGYLCSFLEICEQSKIEFDLTYDTVKNLVLGLGAMFTVQKKTCDHATNVALVAKTLASVLSYLAINEHDYWFRSTRYLEQIQAGKGPAQPLWADVDSIAVGEKSKYVDFLASSLKAARPGSVMAPAGLTLQFDDVVAEYKALTGVDLTKNGLKNLSIN